MLWPRALMFSRRSVAALASIQHRTLSTGVPPLPPPPPMPTTPAPVLLSTYIARALASYFASAAPVGCASSLPPLPSLSGRAAYISAVAAAYAAQPGAWLTPSDLFSPHYGRGVAAFISARHARAAPRGAPLHIVEVGSGRGTLARDILDAIAGADGALYARTRYATLDVSPGLVSAARATLGAAGHGPAVFTPTLGDACEEDGWAGVAQALGASEPSTPPFILACEVLDNLPHDRVERVDGEDGAASAWAQAEVVWGGPGGGAPPVEVLRPLADPVIEACLVAALEGGPRSAPPPSLLARLADFALGEGPPPWAPPAPADPAAAACLFLPTGAARMLAAASAAFPAHILLAFDFDALPTTLAGGGGGGGGGRAGARARAQPCWGAPVVSGPPAPGSPAVDYPSILAAPPGTADILFPTDFGLLARLCERGWGGGEDGRVAVTTVMKSAAFFAAAPGVAAAATASGYNPLVEDFTNTAALIVERSVGRDGV